MKYTSSARRVVALLLSVAIVLEGTGMAGWASAEIRTETCILLKLSDSSVPEETARQRMAPLPRLLQRDLGVHWTSPAAAPARQDPREIFPEPDDASLERISGALAGAIRSMERVELEDAASLLSKAEGEARKFRLGEGTRPLLAEIFLRRGLLNLWEGKQVGAEELFARSRALRPGFSPDPAMFSPSFREAWTRAGLRAAPETELLVQSIPPGASISVDGKPMGRTPARIRVSSPAPVLIRLSLAGYNDAERVGQWLPGDSESLEWVLGRDRLASLGDMLAESPEGKGSGRLLAELAAGAGAARVGVMIMEERNGKPFVRVLSSAGGNADPSYLGEFEWPEGEDGPSEAARRTAKMLRDAGWLPAKESTQEAGTSWYDKWWIWVLVGAIAAGVAAGVAGGGGGGGSSGGSTGTVGVSF